MLQPKINEIYLEKIHFLANPVGSGKTQAALDTIRLNDDESHIFVSPTNVLATEIMERMEADLADSSIVKHIQLINGETIKKCDEDIRKKTVSEAVLHVIRNQSLDQPHILIVTTQTFRNVLPQISHNDKSRYNVYLDEGIDVLKRAEAHTGDITPQYRDILNCNHETGELTIKNGSRGTVRNIAEGNDKALGLRGGLVQANFVEIAKMLTNDLYKVYGSIGEASIRCIGLLEPDHFLTFKSVTMIVALFEQSPLAVYWKKSKGIKFQVFNHTCSLFDTHSEKGPLISIYHVLHSDDNASKAVLTTDIEGKKIYQHAGKITEDFFAGEKKSYCYSVNNFFKNPTEALPSGSWMPVKSAGLNIWKDYDNVAALSSSLPETWVKDIIIKLLGVSGQEFYRLWRMASTYQTIGRCSIRNRDKSDLITIVVLSEEEAEDLHTLFKGSKFLGQLGNLPSIKQLRASSKNKMTYKAADNNAYYRYKNSCSNSSEVPLDKETWYQKIRLNRRNLELAV